MPDINVIYDPFEEPRFTSDPTPDLSDMLIAPVSEQELEPEEPTPQEIRQDAFREHAADRDRLSLGEWNQPGRGRIRNGTEVCQFTGWPRRHLSVGKHCPHGMLDEQDTITDGRVQ